MRRLGPNVAIAGLLILGLVAPLVPVPRASAQEPPTVELDAATAQATALIEELAREEIAFQLARTSYTLVQRDQISLFSVKAACGLVRRAVELAPESPAIWRRAYDIAVLSEDDELRVAALSAIGRLDPADDAVQLKRLVTAIDERYQIMDERIEAYRWLVMSADLPDTVRSRLSLDLALLYQRNDDLERFGEMLTLALEFDPSNREAAAIAAGFFRMHVDEPAGEAELLLNLLLADPANIISMVRFGSLMLEHGAYVGAARLYELVGATLAAVDRAPDSELLSDQAMARWGAGDPSGAIALIERQQVTADRLQLRMMLEKDPDLDLDPIERARVQGWLAPVLATLRVAIPAIEEDGEAAALAYTEVMRIYRDGLSGDLLGFQADENSRAVLRLRMAWTILAFGDEYDEVEQLLADAAAHAEVEAAARARFEGWLALRRGQPQEALDLLAEPAQVDGFASLGVALALDELGREQEADAQFYETFLNQPGTIVGLWARRRLEQRRGGRLPLTTTAARLEAVLETLPHIVDRFPIAPSLAIETRAEFRQLTYKPFDPVILDIQIWNNSRFPLAIDADGPLRPTVVVKLESSFGRRGLRTEMQPLVVGIDQRLRIPPHSRIDIEVDLRLFRPGLELTLGALSGTFLRAKVYANPIAGSELTFRPGPLGAQDSTSTARVEGIAVNTEWLQSANVAIRTGTPEERLVAIGLMTQLASQSADPQDSSSAGLLAQTRLLVDGSYNLLGPLGKAWQISVAPTGRLTPAMRQAAIDSTDDDVRTSYLINHILDPNDPILRIALAAEEGSTMRLLAEIVAERFQQEVDS